MALKAAQAAYAAEISASATKQAPDTTALDREEEKLLTLAKSGALSQDIVGVALVELDRKRKVVVKTAKIEQTKDLDLSARRYSAAIDSLGELGTPEFADDAQSAVRELLGGQGTVFERGGWIAAEFKLSGFLGVAAAVSGKNL